ncbi:pheST operon leader peptide PheM [Xenorhabdus nematophila]
MMTLAFFRFFFYFSA